MYNNIFTDISYKSICSNNHINPFYSCPYNRCRSLDNSINIKIQTKPMASINLLLRKQYIDNKIKYSRNDQRYQNVYYRSFDSPKRRGLSPNGSKKIVIQYSSPQPILNNTRTSFNSYKPYNSIKTSYIVSSPIKSNSPKNIYTNQNTPPKAKYLQKRQSRQHTRKYSRKHSQDNIKYTTPIQGLTLVDSQRIKKTSIQDNKNSVKLYKISQRLIQKHENREVKQPQLPKRINNMNDIHQTQTKNIIPRNSSPQSSSSPFNSLVDSTPQVIPYGSFSSSPIMQMNQSSKRQNSISIKQISQFKGKLQSEPQMSRKSSEPLQIINRIVLTPKSKELTPKGDRYLHDRFDKTLGKSKNVNQYNNNQNQLIYSESDKQTLYNQTGSQKNLVNNMEKEGVVKSEKNIRNIPQKNIFSKKGNNFETVQISDNFETPKSKYKGVRQQTKRQNNNKDNKVLTGIKFYPLGENRKSKMSNASNSKNEQRKNTSRIQNKKQVIQKQFNSQSQPYIRMGRQQRSELEEGVKMKSVQQSKQQKNQYVNKKQDGQVEKQNEDIEQSNSSVSNVFAAELIEGLRLNYDYYICGMGDGLNKDKTQTNKQSFKKSINKSHPQIQQKTIYTQQFQSVNDVNRQMYDRKYYNQKHIPYGGNYIGKDSSTSESQDIDITF